MYQVLLAHAQQYLVTLLVLGCTIGVGYVTTVLAPKATKFVDAHLDADTAQKVNAAIYGLSHIAEDVVQHFNQTVVNDAKSAGTFTPDVAKSVLNDAIAAVKSQGSSFVQVLAKAGNDAEGIILSKVQAAVGKYKTSVIAQVPSTPTVQSDVTPPQAAQGVADSAGVPAPATA